MPKGGKRVGAGRKKGSCNRVSAALREAAAASGEMPLEYMLRVMRDDRTTENRRDDMAKAAAPYLHAKLASIEHSGPDGGPQEHVHRVEQVIVDPSG